MLRYLCVQHYILHRVGIQNRTQNREGFVMKEVTNPAEATLYQSTYQTVHCTTSKRYQTDEARGQPVPWHRHNIITGNLAIAYAHKTVLFSKTHFDRGSWFLCCSIQVTHINDHAKSHFAILGYRTGDGSSWAWAGQKTVWREHSVGSSALGDAQWFFLFVLNLTPIYN